MSTREQFLGGIKPPKAIHNYWSGGGTEKANFDPDAHQPVGKKYTPSLTATSLTTLLSITGSGQIDALWFRENTAGAKTVRIKVTLDGTVVFDATSPSVSKTAATGCEGMVVLGNVIFAWNGTYKFGHLSAGQPIIFNSSLLIEVVSSTTDAYTDFFVHYRTN